LTWTCLLLTIPCRAATIVVDPNGSADYTTIQAAIDNAANGDTIIAADGIYTGTGNRDIDFTGKTLTVRSDNGPEKCIIDCQAGSGNKHRGFVFHSGESNDSVLTGFTITNGYGPEEDIGYGPQSHGGGIFCRSSSPIINNCLVEDNVAKFGGGIDSYNASPLIEYCIIASNTVSNTGSGISCRNGNPMVSNCTITGNTASFGGGIECVDTTLTISNSIIIKNSATYRGGGIRNIGNITFTNCTISENTAGTAGGGIWCQDSSATIQNCIVWNNTAPTDPGLGSSTMYPSVITVLYSDMQGGYSGTGNINVDPDFVNPAGDDYHLSVGSPCIDSGDPTYSSGPGETDIDGHVRVLYGRVDMGADEYVAQDDPAMMVEPIQFEFKVLKAAGPISQVLTISNINAGVLNWQINENCSWLQAVPPAGATTAGQSSNVNIHVDADGLSSGSYQCTLTVTDSNGINQPAIVDVAISVTEITPSPFWENQITIPDDPFCVQSTSASQPGWVKFTSILLDGYDPNIIYYQDSNQYTFHYDFATEQMDPFIGMTVPEYFDAVLYEDGQEASLGALIIPYDDGIKEYGIQFIRQDPYTREQIRDMFYMVESTVVASPAYEAFYFPTYEQYPAAEDDSAWLLAHGIKVGSIAQWIDGNICYSAGWALGELKYFIGSQIQSAYLSGQLKSNDILLTDGVPAEIPMVAGVMTLSPTTPNSHVAILAKTYGIPFVFLGLSNDADTAQQMVGFNTLLCVEENAGVCNVDITDAEAVFTQSEINDMLALKEPVALNISPMAVYGAYSTDANELMPADIQYFGGKTANYGILRQAIPDNSPEAIGISFDLWNEFLDQIIVPRDSVTIEPNSFELFWADRDIGQGSNHADFKLNDAGEYIGLYDRDGTTLIDGITFGLQSNDVSYGRSIDGGDTWQFFAGGSATPGEENSPAPSSGSGLVINEFMAENDSFIQDNFGEHDDWFELYNASGAVIDLGGMYLTDDPDDPTGWMIPPAVTGSTLRQEIANRLSGYTYPPTDIAALSEDLSAIRSLFKNPYITSFTSAQVNAIETVLQNNFDVNEKIRFRSSTNVEDSDQFVGAGLYDSYSGCLADDLDGDDDGPSICDPSETNERGVFRAIRKVFASFYNDNAFLERLKYGVDPDEVGMALLVHHSFPDEIELANGVATLEKSSSGPEKTIKLITQKGATSVANPTDGSIPEEVSVYVNASGVIILTFISGSNLVILGEKVMDWQTDYVELAQLLVDASVEFENQTGKNDYILDFEYKKLAPGGAAIPEGGLVVKQVRRIPRINPAELECPEPVYPTACPTQCPGPWSGDIWCSRFFTSPDGVFIETHYDLYCGGFCIDAVFSEWYGTIIEGLTTEPIYLSSCASQCYTAGHHNWCENFFFEPMFEPGISQCIVDQLRLMNVKSIELYNINYCGQPGIRYYDFDGQVFNQKPYLGDFDHDGDIDISDLIAMAHRWLEDDCALCGGVDLNCDDKVNHQDFGELGKNWQVGVNP
jgi:hypothetical protein